MTWQERLRQWTRPRALLLHLAFVAITSGCLTAAWWQVHRAAQGNTLSYLYSIEWPAFAAVAGIGWWQMVHDTDDDIARRRLFHQRMRQASAEVVARTLPRSATALTVVSTELDGRTLASAARPAVTAGSTDPGSSLLAGRAPTPETGPDDGGNDLDAVLVGTADDDAPTDELTEYNRYLAYLAVRGKAKTWRNPRGL